MTRQFRSLIETPPLLLAALVALASPLGAAAISPDASASPPSRRLSAVDSRRCSPTLDRLGGLWSKFDVVSDSLAAAVARATDLGTLDLIAAQVEEVRGFYESVGRIALGPYGFYMAARDLTRRGLGRYNQLTEAGIEGSRAALDAVLFVAIEQTGVKGFYEGAARVDLETGLALGRDESIERGLIGSAQLGLTIFGGASALNSSGVVGSASSSAGRFFVRHPRLNPLNYELEQGYVGSLFPGKPRYVGPKTSTPTTVEQYALVARREGYYPVMKRGFAEPQGQVRLNAGDPWKYGVTKNPDTRYSEAWLNRMGLRYRRQFLGTRTEALTAEKENILGHLGRCETLPPGNKIRR